MKSSPDLRVLWYRAPALGVAWWPEVVGDDSDVDTSKAKLRKRFNGKGGVETMVKEYVEVTEAKP